MTWIEDNWSKWVVRNRWWVIVATVLVVIIASSGTRYLTLNRDLRVFFSEENPQLQALEALENTYNRIDNVMFVIAPRDGTVFTRSTLSAVEKLTEGSWSLIDGKGQQPSWREQGSPVFESIDPRRSAVALDGQDHPGALCTYPEKFRKKPAGFGCMFKGFQA